MNEELLNYASFIIYACCLTLWQMGPIGCPETSVNNHRSTLPNITKERNSHTTAEAWKTAKPRIDSCCSYAFTDYALVLFNSELLPKILKEVTRPCFASQCICLLRDGVFHVYGMYRRNI